MAKRVMVCGGRDFDDWDSLCEELTYLLGNVEITAIIHGGARGADKMAGEFAAATNMRRRSANTLLVLSRKGRAMVIEVVTKYSFGGTFGMDDAANHAAGRVSDFSGCGFGERDLGWSCKSEFEAEKIKRGLAKIGMTATIRYT